jgi:hypothetical protein
MGCQFWGLACMGRGVLGMVRQDATQELETVLQTHTTLAILT